MSTVNIFNGRVGTSTLATVAGGLNHDDRRKKVKKFSWSVTLREKLYNVKCFGGALNIFTVDKL